MGTDANGLDPEQQALLASIMEKSSQMGGGGFGAFKPAANNTEPSADAGSNRMMSQSEIDALIASMSK